MANNYKNYSHERLIRELRLRDLQIARLRRQRLGGSEQTGNTPQIQARLQTILDTAGNGIITTNSKGSICTFNRAAERMFGYSGAEIIGHNISLLMPSPYREQHDTFLDRYLKSGRSDIISKPRDLCGQRKDGAVFPMSLVLGTFFHGKERFFTGIVTDISERKAAENALIASEERLAFAMEASGEGMWDWDIANGKAMHNRKWFELLGLPKDADNLAPEFFTALIHQDDRESVLNRLRQALAGDGLYRSEHRLRNTEGNIIWVLEQGRVVQRDASGKPLRMVGSFADITDRKKADCALLESEQRFRQITESLPQLVWTCLPDGACDYLSRQWIEFTGIPEAEQLGFNWLEQIHPADKKSLLRKWKATVAAGMFYKVEYRIRRHDGSYHWFDGRAIPLRDEEGKIRKWFGSSTDITERKQMERKLREHERHYERLLKLEVASQTAAAIAHEMNQPLNAAASYTDAALRLLQAETPNHEQLRTALLFSANQIQRGGQVIHELCRFLRGGEITTKMFDLGELVAKVILNLETEADGQLGEFIVKADVIGKCPAVRGDPVQVEKVLNNLLRNGIEAMQEGAQASGFLFVSVSPANDGKCAQITVRDTGPGLSDTALKQLFHPFFTTKAKGLGIGLAISRAMINAHGGDLWAEAGATPGATFCMTLPFAAEAAP